MKRHHTLRTPIVLLACVLWFGPAGAQPTTIAQDAKAAIASYADQKVKETIKEQSRGDHGALQEGLPFGR